jgi:hypothetical protein
LNASLGNSLTIDANDGQQANCPRSRPAMSAPRVFSPKNCVMTVDTKIITERRRVQYESLGEFLADAECQAARDVRTSGNWTLSQIFDHLTRSLCVAVEGTDARFPWLARVFLHVIRARFLSRPMKPGFHVPPPLERALRPAEGLTTQDALQNLREAVERFESAPQLVVHPAFGRLTREEWTQLTLRHAELHMSFVHSSELHASVAAV